MITDTLITDAITSDGKRPDPVTAASKARRERILLRRFFKARLIADCAKQALAAKARLCQSGTGKNGQSMNDALALRHINAR